MQVREPVEKLFPVVNVLVRPTANSLLDLSDSSGVGIIGAADEKSYKWTQRQHPYIFTMPVQSYL